MSRNLSPADALKLAVERTGSQTAFAELCGVSQTAVWKWLDGDKHLPAEHVLKVEAATGVSRHELRPDIYPLEPPAPTEAAFPRGAALASSSPEDGASDPSPDPLAGLVA